jgi:hypothetical protein
MSGIGLMTHLVLVAIDYGAVDMPKSHFESLLGSAPRSGSSSELGSAHSRPSNLSRCR